VIDIYSSSIQFKPFHLILTINDTDHLSLTIINNRNPDSCSIDNMPLVMIMMTIIIIIIITSSKLDYKREGVKCVCNTCVSV